DLSGMHFLRAEGKTVVKKVDEGSPAAICGVRAGDELLVVGDCRTAESRLHALRLLLCAEGKRVRVGLRRAGRELEVSLTLADWSRPARLK
ncbi:MAG TPA: S1C family serine protease, partial [Gemmataceae bacterium]|nr:S1C family serine protease [Gemmataceae bacterium]